MALQYIGKNKNWSKIINKVNIILRDDNFQFALEEVLNEEVFEYLLMKIYGDYIVYVDTFYDPLNSDVEYFDKMKLLLKLNASKFNSSINQMTSYLLQFYLNFSLTDFDRKSILKTNSIIHQFALMN